MQLILNLSTLKQWKAKLTSMQFEIKKCYPLIISHGMLSFLSAHHLNITAISTITLFTIHAVPTKKKVILLLDKISSIVSWCIKPHFANVKGNRMHINYLITITESHYIFQTMKDSVPHRCKLKLQCSGHFNVAEN